MKQRMNFIYFGPIYFVQVFFKYISVFVPEFNQSFCLIFFFIWKDFAILLSLCDVVPLKENIIMIIIKNTSWVIWSRSELVNVVDIYLCEHDLSIVKLVLFLRRLKKGHLIFILPHQKSISILIPFCLTKISGGDIGYWN